MLAVAGVVVSGISLAHHYSASTTSFCDFGESFNCDIVNKSEYSSIAGVPVALVGILGYLALLALATVYRSRENVPTLLFGAALAGLIFALYLTYVEAYILTVWCVLCLSSLFLIFCITVLSGITLLQQRRRREVHS